MSVRILMACVPKYFRCKLEMPSGPVKDVFFCLTDGLTNNLCCEWWHHVCVLENGVVV